MKRKIRVKGESYSKIKKRERPFKIVEVKEYNIIKK